MRTLPVIFALYRAAIRAEMQYRVNFVMLLVLGVVYQSSGFAFVWIVLRHFDTIAGWTFPQVALLYSLRLLAHATWVVPFNQVERLEETIREGRFDRFLVRPLNPFLQVVTARAQINVIGDVVAAVALFWVAVSLLDLHLTPLKVGYLILAVVGGGLVEGAVVVAVSSMAFRFVRTWAAVHFADNSFLLFGSYPTNIFGRALSWVLTWLVPVAFVAYIPAGVLLDKAGSLTVPAPVALAAPVAGMVWFAAAYHFWRWQIRGYQSAGG